MDWNDRMAQARAEYEDLESKEATAHERMGQATAQYEDLVQQGHSALATFALRKSQLEGQMSIIGELLTDLPIGDWTDARGFEYLAENPADGSSAVGDAADVLQSIVETNPPEAALAILNGIDEQLKETADA